jgi:hypothetical protein
MVRCPGNARKLLEFAWDYDVRKWKHCWTRKPVVEPTVSAFEGTLFPLKKTRGEVHNPRTMRVLIADRNARLLESISRTFAQQFAIQTAASCEQCNDLLAQGDFDLVLISEKLADGLGLQLLGQIARSSPDTLRVFAARRSRLQLLKGKLGPFGLFRTLNYPINPQELLSTLTLAQTGLAIGGPAQGSEEAPDVQPQGEVSTPPPARAEVQPVVERISLTSADATFTIDVPKTILSQRRVRRSNPSPAHRPASRARQAPAPAAAVRNAAAGVPSTAPQSRKATRELPSTARQTQKTSPELPSTARQTQKTSSELPSTARQTQKAPPEVPSTTPQRQQAPPELPSAKHQGQQASSELPGTTRQAQQPPAPRRSARSQAAVAQPTAPARAPLQARPSQHAPKSRRAANRPVVGTSYSMRSKVVLAATSVVVFLVTTLTHNLNDASVHVTRASTPVPKLELPPAPEPPATLAPAFRPQPSVARRVEPKPVVDPADEQVTASNAPVADPSSFGHEAYEVIYAN